jgi:hypothetical protein
MGQKWQKMNVMRADIAQAQAINDDLAPITPSPIPSASAAAAPVATSTKRERTEATITTLTDFLNAASDNIVENAGHLWFRVPTFLPLGVKRKFANYQLNYDDVSSERFGVSQRQFSRRTHKGKSHICFLNADRTTQPDMSGDIAVEAQQKAFEFLLQNALKDVVETYETSTKQRANQAEVVKAGLIALSELKTNLIAMQSLPEEELDDNMAAHMKIATIETTHDSSSRVRISVGLGVVCCHVHVSEDSSKLVVRTIRYGVVSKDEMFDIHPHTDGGSAGWIHACVVIVDSIKPVCYGGGTDLFNIIARSLDSSYEIPKQSKFVDQMVVSAVYRGQGKLKKHVGEIEEEVLQVAGRITQAYHIRSSQCSGVTDGIGACCADCADLDKGLRNTEKELRKKFKKNNPDAAASTNVPGAIRQLGAHEKTKSEKRQAMIVERLEAKLKASDDELGKARDLYDQIKSKYERYLGSFGDSKSNTIAAERYHQLGAILTDERVWGNIPEHFQCFILDQIKYWAADLHGKKNGLQWSDEAKEICVKILIKEGKNGTFDVYYYVR